MALPDYSHLVAGTAITWSASGGDKTLTLTSLSNGSAREGGKSGTLVDGTLGMPEVLEFRLNIALTAAGTTGNEVPFYIGESDSATAGTNNPGGLTGADAALNTDYLGQLFPVGSLIIANNAGSGVQRQRFIYMPIQAYVIPVVYNNSGTNFGSTAGNFELVMTPFYRKLAE